jgi:2-iminobutanoate/2-iminopropanoate deaminase
MTWSRTAATGTTPGGAYSPGIVAEGRFVYVSGQVASPGSIEQETRDVLDKVMKVLASAGADASHVVRCGVYLADVGDFDAMNAVYAEYFPDPKPARTTIGATLAGDFRIEIDCVAVVP